MSNWSMVRSTDKYTYYYWQMSLSSNVSTAKVRPAEYRPTNGSLPGDNVSDVLTVLFKVHKLLIVRTIVLHNRTEITNGEVLLNEKLITTTWYFVLRTSYFVHIAV